MGVIDEHRLLLLREQACPVARLGLPDVIGDRRSEKAIADLQAKENLTAPNAAARGGGGD